MPPPVGTTANPATGGKGHYSKRFRALVAYLQAHPALQGYVRTWRVWDGNNADETEGTPDQCPWIRLTPSIMPATYKAEDGTLRYVVTPLKINIETAVVDTSFELSDQFWFNLDAALFPSEADDIAKLKAVLRAARITDLTLIQPALPAALASYGGGMIIGDGAIQLDIVLEML